MYLEPGFPAMRALTGVVSVCSAVPKKAAHSRVIIEIDRYFKFILSSQMLCQYIYYNPPYDFMQASSLKID
jgi:hypothetical protein